MITREQVGRTVVRLVSENLRIKSETVKMDSTLEDLGADSMDALDILMDVEGEYSVDTGIMDGYYLREPVSALVDKVYGLLTQRPPDPVFLPEPMSAHFDIAFVSDPMEQHKLVGEALADYAMHRVDSVVYGARRSEGVQRCHVHITYTERK